MGRIRSIKPEFPQSESIGRVSRDARLLFLQLLTIVDDDGRTRGASRMLASLLYPYDEDAGCLIDGWLGELEKEKQIRRYTVDGHSYLAVLNFRQHQKIDHPTPSKLPPFPEGSPTPREDSRSLAPEGRGEEGRGEEGKGRDQARSRAGSAPFKPPSKPDPTHAVPDGADKRIFCERVGCFDMKQQSALSMLYEAYCRNKGTGAEAAMEHLVSRWVEYQAECPKHEWTWGSAYAFYMSGKWDDPRSWPRGKGRLDKYEEYLIREESA